VEPTLSQIDRLLQPFRRLTPDRGNNNDGHGLGLSIVAAITSAHDATLNIKPRPDGGLHITIEFPAVWTDHENAPPPLRRKARRHISGDDRRRRAQNWSIGRADHDLEVVSRNAPNRRSVSSRRFGLCHAP
jgi:hypothetical protein